MPTILALDTSTEACSVSLFHHDQTYSNFMLSNRDHAKQILPMIDRLLKGADCSLHEVDAIAFAQGPGSFTGIRIGVAIAQGLGFGLNKPLIPVSTLTILAEGAYRLTGTTKVLTAIDARMNEIYFDALIKNEDGDWNSVAEPSVIAPDLAISNLIATDFFKDLKLSLNDFGIAGTGWEAYPNIKPFDEKNASVITSLPQSQDLLSIAMREYIENRGIDAADAEPLYLRNQVTWKKLDRR